MNYYHKYHAKKTPCHYGHIHDSKKEAKRCDELHILEEKGIISNLEFQKKYLLIHAYYKEIELNEVYKSGKKKGQRKRKKVCDEHASYYKADFVYFDNGLNKNIIEDAKGVHTPLYILKRKLMKQKYCNENTVFIES